jgi:Skp family chaperone for outer membrane proteins
LESSLEEKTKTIELQSAEHEENRSNDRHAFDQQIESSRRELEAEHSSNAALSSRVSELQNLINETVRKAEQVSILLISFGQNLLTKSNLVKLKFAIMTLCGFKIP